MIRESEDLVFDTLEMICTYVFIVEMFIKWYAFGFYGKYNEDVNPDCLFEEEEPYKGYYNDGWNSLDFLVVLASLPTLFGIQMIFCMNNSVR